MIHMPSGNLVLTNIAIENGPIEIVSVPLTSINSMGIFHSYVHFPEGTRYRWNMPDHSLVTVDNQGQFQQPMDWR